VALPQSATQVDAEVATAAVIPELVAAKLGEVSRAREDFEVGSHSHPGDDLARLNSLKGPSQTEDSTEPIKKAEDPPRVTINASKNDFQLNDDEIRNITAAPSETHDLQSFLSLRQSGVFNEKHRGQGRSGDAQRQLNLSDIPAYLKNEDSDRDLAPFDCLRCLTPLPGNAKFCLICGARQFSESSLLEGALNSNLLDSVSQLEGDTAFHVCQETPIFKISQVETIEPREVQREVFVENITKLRLRQEQVSTKLDKLLDGEMWWKKL
jgi:hypothetical protein